MTDVTISANPVPSHKATPETSEQKRRPHSASITPVGAPISIRAALALDQTVTPSQLKSQPAPQPHYSSPPIHRVELANQSVVFTPPTPTSSSSSIPVVSLTPQPQSSQSSLGSLVEMDTTFAGTTPSRMGRSPKKRPRFSNLLKSISSQISREEEVLKQRVANILETYSKESSSVESTPAKKRCKSRNQISGEATPSAKTPPAAREGPVSVRPSTSQSNGHPIIYRSKQEFNSVSPCANRVLLKQVNGFSSPSVVSLSDSPNTSHPECESSEESVILLLEKPTPSSPKKKMVRIDKIRAVSKVTPRVNIELDNDSSEDSCDDIEEEESPKSKIKKENAFSANFIGMVRTCPLLYDRKHANFYSNQARRRAYEQLGELMKMKGWQVCKRWRKEIKEFEFLTNEHGSRKALEKTALFRNMEWYIPHAHFEKDILMEDEMFDSDFIAENEVCTLNRFPIEKPRNGYGEGPCSSSSCSITPRATILKEDLSSVPSHTLSSDDSKAFLPSEVEVLDASRAVGNSVSASLRTMKNKKKEKVIKEIKKVLFMSYLEPDVDEDD